MFIKPVEPYYFFCHLKTERKIACYCWSWKCPSVIMWRFFRMILFKLIFIVLFFKNALHRKEGFLITNILSTKNEMNWKNNYSMKVCFSFKIYEKSHIWRSILRQQLSLLVCTIVCRIQRKTRDYTTFYCFSPV